MFIFIDLKQKYSIVKQPLIIKHLKNLIIALENVVIHRLQHVYFMNAFILNTMKLICTGLRLKSSNISGFRSLIFFCFDPK